MITIQKLYTVTHAFSFSTISDIYYQTSCYFPSYWDWILYADYLCDDYDWTFLNWCRSARLVIHRSCVYMCKRGRPYVNERMTSWNDPFNICLSVFSWENNRSPYCGRLCGGHNQCTESGTNSLRLIGVCHSSWVYTLYLLLIVLAWLVVTNHLCNASYSGHPTCSTTPA